MNFKQKITPVGTSKPIVIVGAGSIVRDAHLPAYKKGGLDVIGVFDVDENKAKNLRNDFPFIRTVFSDLSSMMKFAADEDAVIDIAVPAKYICQILDKVPDGAAVLIQKPMGETLEEAIKIKAICDDKKLVAAVNFQLRYAPYMLAAKDIISEGLIGDVYDMELMVTVFTPWHLWDFLFQLPRVEILYHSIHYLDLMRSFLGKPSKIYASTIKHPKMKELASTRSTMILDYDEYTQARIITNHGHEYGREHQQSYLKIEGTEGAIYIKIGLSLDYPKGEPSTMEYCILNSEPPKWKEVELDGDWFPDAFLGTMVSLQNHYNDKDQPLANSFSDSLETMRLVEKAYESSKTGGEYL
ncbi:Gfo/Idh/MocA family protein [Joostella sp.]|uniref:Gfo/Idh/MocA family protein n=1 Tax=Joostella sp. TaxID=2231138 RepID=UPI003A8EAA9F